MSVSRSVCEARELPAALLDDPDFELLLHKRAEDFAAT
jgi:hypothetical protein